METDAACWALNGWLFTAYRQGLKDGERGYVSREIAMTWMIGPNWREEEKQIALDYAREYPEEAAFLASLAAEGRI